MSVCTYVGCFARIYQDPKLSVTPKWYHRVAPWILQCLGIPNLGVPTTEKTGEIFPTRILTLKSYWGIPPVKSQFRPVIDPLKLDITFLMRKMRPS